MNANEIFKFETYYGTMDSLEKMVNNLKLEYHEYHFDVKNKSITLPKQGIRYLPGDTYTYHLPEIF